MSTTIDSYSLNAEGAKSIRATSRLEEKGAYVGTITRAEAVTSSKGTHGVELAFKTDDGRTADYLSLWTVNADGEGLPGRRVLDAIMAVARLRKVSIAPGKVRKWDAAAGQEAEKPAKVLPELTGKRVGLFLVREEYAKNDGTTGWKFIVIGAFDAETQALPVEILEQRPPAGFDGFLASLRDRPLKASKSTAARAPAHAGSADDDQDIPF